MKDVVCWCCDYFCDFEKTEISNHKFISGICALTNSIRFSEDDVCEEFLLRSGLFTKREIPDICKRYRNGIYIDDKK